ncbi:MAG: SRPBCC family protein [Bacteroidota bacterium]
MKSNIIAEVSTVIHTQLSTLWEALTKPEIVKEYFFGTDLSTTWEPGAPIIFSGEWQGKKYEDKGTVLAYNKEEMLQYTYWSSMSGIEDKPENYVTLTYRIGGKDGKATVTIIQENIPDEKTRDHSIENWKKVLQALKKLLEAKEVMGT